MQCGEINQLKQLLVDACRILYVERHHDHYLGHASVRLQGTDTMLMKPNSLGFEETKVDDVITVDFNGAVLEGKHKRHGEYPIHSEIYRRRPEINCVIHTHPLYIVLLSTMNEPLEIINHDGVLFWRGIPVFRGTPDLIVTAAQGQALAESLGSNSVVLIQNHGAVIVGESVEEAIMLSLHLEKAAQIHLLAKSTGRGYSCMNLGIAEKMGKDALGNKKRLADLFQYHKRIADQLLKA